jgi:hypothetical protein
MEACMSVLTQRQGFSPGYSVSLQAACERFVRIAQSIPALYQCAAQLRDRVRETERLHREAPTPMGLVVLEAERAMAYEARAAVGRAEQDLEDARVACRLAWARRGDE